MSCTLVKLLGFPATLIHGDMLVLDRWLWLKKRLPIAHHERLKLLDVGCGSGAFTIGAALRGYDALGLSWDDTNNNKATERASICKATIAHFQKQDVRKLGDCVEFKDKFDVVICLENIEHILDDKKLMRDMQACLKKNGKLLLTTPNIDYRPITKGDEGPFPPVETGGHVRKGYSKKQLHDLCYHAGFVVDEISFCSGFLSQKSAFLWRTLSGYHPILGWALTLPLRIFPPLGDSIISKITNWPGFSICLVAHKSF